MTLFAAKAGFDHTFLSDARAEYTKNDPYHFFNHGSFSLQLFIFPEFSKDIPSYSSPALTKPVPENGAEYAPILFQVSFQPLSGHFP